MESRGKWPQYGIEMQRERFASLFSVTRIFTLPPFALTEIHVSVQKTETLTSTLLEGTARAGWVSVRMREGAQDARADSLVSRS